MLRVGTGGDFRLGGWLVQPAQCRLSKDGRTVQVRAKVMDLLAYLASRQGQVVSKDDLLNDVWGSLAVSESALTRTVTELRHVLEDDADHPQLLETIAKRGYRVIATVAYVHASPDQPLSGPPPSDGAHAPAAFAQGDGRSQGAPQAAVAPYHRLRRPWPSPVWRLAGGAAAILGVGLGLGYMHPEYGAAPPIAQVGNRATPLTTYRGLEIDPDVSADGSQVVFAHSSDAATWDFDLHVMTVGEGAAVRLTADPLTSDLSPTWSPDGRRIAFLRRRSGVPEQLIVMPALGGTERHIAPLETGVALLGDGLISWTPDGRWIVVGAAVGGTRGLWLFEADGDGRTRLISTPAAVRDRSPVVSADGRYLAFIRQSSAYGGTLCVLPLGPRYETTGPVATVVALAPLQVVAVAWTPDDEALVYAVGGHHAPSRLYRAALTGDRLSLQGEPEVLQVGDMAGGVDISPSGHLAYMVMRRDTRFWRLDLAAVANGVQDARLFESTLDEATPHYSPDGTRIAFASTRSGTQEIWIGNVDGTGLRQVTQMGGALCMDPRWSPDGRRLLFASDRGGTSDVYEFDDAHATSRRLTSTAATETAASWSRDGETIYYASDVTGRSEIWKMPAAGGAAVQVTRDGGLAAEESHDGRELLVARIDEGGLGLWRMPIQGGEPALLAEGLTVPTHFAVGRAAVYYLAGASHGRRTPAERGRATGNTRDDVAVMKVELSTGRIERLAPYETGFWYGLALSPDERTLLGVLATGGTDLMFVEPARQRP